jgi:hypothetical protein
MRPALPKRRSRGPGVLLRKLPIVLLLAMVFGAWPSFAKEAEQDKIILLNDAACALEDSNPVLSKTIAQLAEEQEKEWEYTTANKNPSPVFDKNIPSLNEQIKDLKAAAFAITPVYPLIAKALDNMAKEMEVHR